MLTPVSIMYMFTRAARMVVRSKRDLPEDSWAGVSLSRCTSLCRCHLEAVFEAVDREVVVRRRQRVAISLRGFTIEGSGYG